MVSSVKVLIKRKSEPTSQAMPFRKRNFFLLLKKFYKTGNHLSMTNLRKLNVDKIKPLPL